MTRGSILATLVFLLVAAAGFAQPPAPQSAAAAYVGRPVVAVQLLSEGRPLEDEAAAALVATRVGQPLSMADVRESITHLFGLGRFQDVRVDASEAPGGVLLRYDLIPLHTVQRVDFRAAGDVAVAAGKGLGLDEGLLRRTMTNRFGASPPVGRAPEVARTIEQLYHDHGYLRATVHPVATEEHDPDRTLLAFEIVPGPRAVVGNVQVEGDPGRGARCIPERGARLSVRAVRAARDFGRPLHLRAEAPQVRALRSGGILSRPPLCRRDDCGPDDLRADRTARHDCLSTATRSHATASTELVPMAREGSVDEDLIEDSVQRIKRY